MYSGLYIIVLYCTVEMHTACVCKSPRQVLSSIVCARILFGRAVYGGIILHMANGEILYVDTVRKSHGIDISKSGTARHGER